MICGLAMTITYASVHSILRNLLPILTGQHTLDPDRASFISLVTVLRTKMCLYKFH